MLSSPIPLNLNNEIYVLNNSPRIVEDLGSFLLKSGDYPTYGMYRNPIIDNGQPHLILMYYTLNNVQGKPTNQLFDINVVTGVWSETDGDGLKLQNNFVAHPNGKIYFGNRNLTEYDPITKVNRLIGDASDNQINSLCVDPNGVVYLGEGQKGYIDRYDPSTGVFESLGIMDDPKLRGSQYGTYRYGWSICSDGRYVYEVIRDQNEGWEVIGYDTETKTQRAYWRGATKAGVHINQGVVYANYFDAAGNHKFTISGLGDPVPFTGTEPAVPIDRDGTSLKDGVVNECNFSQQFGYEIDGSMLDADTSTGGKATIRWRLHKGTTLGEWQSLTFDILMAPAPIGRALTYSDTELLVRGAGYGAYITVNPNTKTMKVLGQDWISFYNGLKFKDKWYFCGYPEMAFDEYDPTQPWDAPTLGQPGGNPHFLPVAEKGKYNYYIDTDSTSIYLGVHHERTDVGGSICWYNPVTKESGGLREPFLNYDCRGLISVCNGTKLVYSSLAVAPATQPKIFVIDTATKTVQSEYTFTKSSHTGSMIEIEPGIVMGMASGWLYKFDVLNNKMLWIRTSPAGASFGDVSTWNRQLVRGCDGWVWLFIGNYIYRINKSGDFNKVCAATPGIISFFNNDLYITSGTTIRRIRNLFVKKK